MPINVPANSVNVHWGGTDTPLSKRPALAAYLGMFVAEWGNTESALAFTLAVLLNTNAIIAIGLLDRIRSTRNKFGILRFAVAEIVKDPKLRNQFLSAVKMVEDLSTKRNDLIHGRWGVSESYPEHLIWSKNSFELQKPLLGYDASDLVEEISKVERATAGLMQLSMRLGNSTNG